MAKVPSWAWLFWVTGESLEPWEDHGKLMDHSEVILGGCVPLTNCLPPQVERCMFDAGALRWQLWQLKGLAHHGIPWHTHLNREFFKYLRKIKMNPAA